MKLIELHILQSFPVSCLNRDEVGSPKTAVFGGVSRARISSQCLKRAIRQLAQMEYPKSKFAGVRTKLLAKQIQSELESRYKMPPKRALEMACAVAGLLNKKAGNPLPTDKPETEALFFASPKQITTLSDVAFKEFGPKGEIKAEKKKKTFVKACLEDGIHDAADIALFGRMVAADASLTLEGAAMFSHALSTHRASNEIDFYTAIEEDDDKEDLAGAAMMGALEFSSAVYYRYAGVNLSMLADEKHLGRISVEERREVIDAFIQATILAVPGARKNSMNANTLPGYVLGLVRKKGQPLQLINAFEEPVHSDNGLMEPSIKAMKEHYGKMKQVWSIQPDVETAVPDAPLETFCKEIIAHVI